MYFSYLDIDGVTPTSLKNITKKLQPYRDKIKLVTETCDDQQPEYSLAHAKLSAVHDKIDELKKQFKGINHLILVGIGGSSLGTEAVHSAVDAGKVTLHTLDTVSATAISLLLDEIKTVRSVRQLAVCVISKSGNTAETLVNAGVILEALEKRFTSSIYKQTIFIGNGNTEFLKIGKRLGVTVVPMPNIVGGRYSVTTEVSLVPLALLGHDTDSFISGIVDADSTEFESVSAENAARLYSYVTKNFRHYNFFAFEPRLYNLGAWYRQLTAESLGKETDRSGKPVTKGFIPTVSTAVELHSVGQLYLSGFAGVYTDFVTFDDDSIDYAIPKKGIAKTYGRYSVQEVATALYGGVMGAYQERQLPYRSTIFDEDIMYSLGLFMAMRMRETMYVAELMNLDAFNQPNVELYKNKTRSILGL